MIPINDEGQTIEGGHRWYLDENGTVDVWRWEIDAYPYCTGAECKECYYSPCNNGCDKGWETTLCEKAQWRPMLPLKLND